MAINTLEYTKIFMETLDKQIIQEATSGWMEANAGQVRYSGGNEVKIPIMSMSGLGDYDRDTGFIMGGVNLSFQTKTLTQDRGRTFQIDAMDVDEANFIATAGSVIGEFQRTKVIPEIDAYRYSAIAAQAIEAGKTNTYIPSSTDILSKLKSDIAAIQDITGDGVQLVITMSFPTATILEQTESITKYIDVVDFQQGTINTKVRAIDGIPIIRVSSSRMKTLYTFFDGKTNGQKEGGFKAADDAKNINWIITPRTAPIAVSKTDVTRIFDPMTNQTANAWKIDYRKYHDIWIPEKAFDSILVSING